MQLVVQIAMNDECIAAARNTKLWFLEKRLHYAVRSRGMIRASDSGSAAICRGGIVSDLLEEHFRKLELPISLACHRDICDVLPMCGLLQSGARP